MFCPTCGSQVPDGTKFCPNCGAAVGQAANAGVSPAPQPATSKKEPGKVRKPLFGSMGIGGIIVLILVTQVIKQGARQITSAPDTTEPTAAEQTQTTPDPSDSTTDGWAISIEQQLTEAYGEVLMLSDCQASVDGSNVRFVLTSAIGSADPDAPELANRFNREILNGFANISVEKIRESEQEYGSSGVTFYVALYYADGTVCGEALINDQGLVDYSLAYQS